GRPESLCRETQAGLEGALGVSAEGGQQTATAARDMARTNLELREEATDRMVKAAIELVAEKGASRLTLAEVGRRAGYSHTLPNYYFKNKTNLLSLVYSNII